MKQNQSLSRNTLAKAHAEQIGKELRARFINQIKRITKSKKDGKYCHGYIYSPPGIGKTYTIKKLLSEAGVNSINITGNVSMFAFGIQLAVISHHNPERERVVVFVDDCDSLFSTEENCNAMKNVLDGTKVFTYEKSLFSQSSNLTDIQRQSVEAHMREDRMGFEVPTDFMTFLFASNFKLPIDDDIRCLKNRMSHRSILLTHKNAIRSRCHVGDYDLNQEELWGWISDVIKTTKCLDPYQLPDSAKDEILDFLWDNWNVLTERSIRVVEKMAITMNEYPDTYHVNWQIDFKQ